MRAPTVVLVLVAAAWSTATAQSLSSVIAAKEQGLGNLATRASALHRARCQSLASCGGDACTVPACGNDFPQSHGFGCSSAYGTNVGRCGTSCPGMVRSLNSSVVRYPPGVSLTDAETQAFTCGTRGLDTDFNSERSSGRIAAWQYIGHDSGSIRIYPGAAQERTTDGCGSYDARLRPWYIAGSSGPKDIVIVIDRSGSMQNDLVSGFPNRGTRMSATLSATTALLGTLSPNDNVGVVAFSSEATVLGGGASLLRGTPANIASLQRQVGGVFADGGTNFNSGLRVAFDLMRATTENANCNRVVLFLTDGRAAETQAEVLANLTQWQAQLPRPAHIFTYSMSSASEDAIPQAVACAHQGVWTKIADGVDPLTKMRSYFQFLASGISSTAVRWTSVYTDAFGLGEMVTAALPVYDSTGGVARLVGVVGADITMAELQSFGDSATTVIAQLYERGRTCAVFSLSECQMQYLRQQSSVGAVCPAPKPTIASCDASSEIVRPSTCTPRTGGLNSALCTAIDATTRVAASGSALTDAEVTCCACGGSGNGRFGSVLPGQGPSAASSDDGGGSTTVIIIVVVVVVVVVIGAVAGGVFFARSRGGPDAQQPAHGGETELERRRRERQEVQARPHNQPDDPGYPLPAQAKPVYGGYPPQQGQPVGQQPVMGYPAQPQQATYV